MDKKNQLAEDKLLNILDKVRLNFKDKFVHEEDLEDFLQDICVYLWNEFIKNRPIYYYTKQFNTMYNKFLRRKIDELKDKNNNFIDYVIEDDTFDKVYKSDLNNKLTQVMTKVPSLTPREIEYISLRFGLDSGFSRTLQEIANTHSHCRETSRRIVNKAIRKLRGSFYRYNFKDLDEYSKPSIFKPIISNKDKYYRLSKKSKRMVLRFYIYEKK